MLRLTLIRLSFVCCWEDCCPAAGAALLFGLFKCVAASYASLDLNGDGVFLLKEIGVNINFYRILPYLITLVVLAFTSKSSRAPKAEGIPYDKGSR